MHLNKIIQFQLVAALSITALTASSWALPADRDIINQNRADHPYVNGMFQNLVSLNQPRPAAGVRPSALQFIADQMQPVKNFADNVYLGPVYPQTVLSYISEADHKEYANSGYYWPANFDSIASELGTKKEYLNIVRQAKMMDMRVIQDVVFNHMGYLPTNSTQKQHYAEVLRERNVEIPANVNIESQGHLWNGWRSIYDPNYFGQMGSIPDSAWSYFENDGVPKSQFDWALNIITGGDLYGLRKINLENPVVLNNMINDHLWYIRDAGVSQFRIDAAKHIKIDPLRKINQALIQGVKNTLPGETPGLFYEYWTTNYKNIRYIIDQLGAGNSDYVYFFDYPLTVRMRSAIVCGQSFKPLGDVLAGRWNSQIPLKSLVPIWIDHDFNPPVFDGSDQSLAQLAAGYMLSYMMSGNAPHYYNGFEKASWGRHPCSPDVPNDPVRKPIDHLLDTDSRAYSTIQSMAKVFNQPIAHLVQASSDNVFINELTDDTIVIERRLDNVKKKLIARIAHSFNPGTEPNGKIVWEFLNPTISVRLYEVDNSDSNGSRYYMR